MSFGEKLQKLRKAQGLSQEELVARLSVTRQTISKWELDQSTPELGLLAQISDIFSVTTDYLIKTEEGDASAGEETPGGAVQQEPQARLTPFIVLLCVGILCMAMIWAPFLSAGDYEVVDTSGKVLYTGFMAYLKAKKAEAVFFLCAGAAAVGLIGLIASAFKESDPSAILPAGGIARFSASATGAPLSAGNRDAIKDAFKPKG